MKPEQIGSREIEFRAWDYQKKRFIQDDRDIQNRDGSNLGEYALSRSGKLFFFESTEGGMETYEVDCFLSFYTGRKDKNGVKIFEGDIVKVYDYINRDDSDGNYEYWSDCSIHLCVYDSENCIFGFLDDGFEDSKFVFGFEKQVPNNEPADSYCEYEVIGNRFENPDLLEASGQV